MKKALMALPYKRWYKSEKRFDNPEIWVDYYRVYNLMGENIYTHFYVEDEALIVDSFKEI
ncbi:MAG: type II toxin-antitoxin system MqsR family toxin [Deltaproteobacteria bacterium]|nr:type II toxin-antitoxin system MqsR family toxin [Deltaproteobacteria bacterium]